MIEKKSAKCLFCSNSILYRVDFNTEIHFCECPNCGDYRISQEAFEDIPNADYYKDNIDNTHLVSGYLRELNDKGLESELITNANYEILYSNALIPKTLTDKLYKLLLYMNRRTSYFTQQISFDLAYPAVAYAKNKEEFIGIIKALLEMKYIGTDFDNRYVEIIGTIENDKTDNVVASLYLTAEGLKKVEELLKQSIESSQGFVAMWFDESMREIYDSYISKAIRDAGFEPCIIRNKEYNDDICDEIMAQIRKSRFLIADTTGHRNGVYYEAGFAYGLNLPIIWACREDHFKDTHFDVNHNNFIVWKTGEDLYTKLKNRILATVI